MRATLEPVANGISRAAFLARPLTLIGRSPASAATMTKLTSVRLLSCALLSFGLSLQWANLASAQFYGAIAYSESTGKIGHCKGHARSQRLAENHAIQECGAPDAKLRITGKGSWLAIAVAEGTVGTAGWADGVSAEDAQSKAIAECRKYANGRPVQVSLCFHTSSKQVVENLQRFPMNIYGAIAFSESTGKFGFCSGHAASDAEARRNAIRECGAKDAKVLVSGTGHWLALGRGQDQSVAAWARSSTERDARSLALKEIGTLTDNTYVAVCFHTNTDEKLVKTLPRPTLLAKAKPPTPVQIPKEPTPAPVKVVAAKPQIPDAYKRYMEELVEGQKLNLREKEVAKFGQEIEKTRQSIEREALAIEAEQVKLQQRSVFANTEWKILDAKRKYADEGRTWQLNDDGTVTLKQHGEAFPTADHAWQYRGNELEIWYRKKGYDKHPTFRGTHEKGLIVGPYYPPSKGKAFPTSTWRLVKIERRKQKPTAQSKKLDKRVQELTTRKRALAQQQHAYQAMQQRLDRDQKLFLSKWKQEQLQRKGPQSSDRSPVGGRETSIVTQ